MALPGITKVRAAARVAELDTLLLRAELTARVRDLAARTVDPALITPMQAVSLLDLCQQVATADAKEQALWAEVDFMEET